MQTLAIGADGVAVARLHHLLLEAGQLPPDARLEVEERRFGHATRGAVLTFQAKQRLERDGVVGGATWRALERGDDVAGDVAGEELPPPDAAHAPAVAAGALLLADAEFRAGVREEPLGSNRGPRVDGYIADVDRSLLRFLRAPAGAPAAADGWQGPPWCAIFVQAMLRRAAAHLGVASPIDGWGVNGRRPLLISAYRWLEAGQARGRVVDAPAPGRVGVILAANGHGHVVLVANVAAERVATREGNSANRVAARWRARTEFAGFVDLGG